MYDLIKKAAEDLAQANMVTALTGAGASIESGLPCFRGKGGLWEKMDPMEVAHIDAFLQDPAKVWRLLVKDMKDVVDFNEESQQQSMAHFGMASPKKIKVQSSSIT